MLLAAGVDRKHSCQQNKASDIEQTQQWSVVRYWLKKEGNCDKKPQTVFCGSLYWKVKGVAFCKFKFEIQKKYSAQHTM